MNILVLGSEGFIGSHLIKHYTARKWDVTGCDQVDLKESEYIYHKISLLSSDLDKLFSSRSFDVCINAAGSGNVGYSITYPLEDFETNTFAVVRVLESIRKHNPACTYLQISSAAVYGNPKELPVREMDSVNPLSPYGWHKLMSECVCQEYTQLFGLKTVIIRPFSVFGPGLKKQLLWEVHQKYLQATKSIELWGKGTETRDFIYITDLVLAIDAILKSGRCAADIFNIASGCETTIRDITSRLLSHFARKIEIKFNQQTRIGDPLNWRADISRLRELGFAPTVLPEEGIRQVANWLNSLS